MKKVISIFLVAIVLLLSNSCCPTYNFKAYQKKTLASDCRAAWDLLTKYFVYQRRDLILVMDNLPLSPKEDFVLQQPDYHNNFVYPLREYVKTHKECFTQFTRKEIEEIFGKPTFENKGAFVEYFIRTGEPIKPECPAWKISKIERTNDISTKDIDSIFDGCRIILIAYNENNYVKTIEFY